MPKLKVPLPLSNGIDNLSSPAAMGSTKLRAARNAYYRRNDGTLRRRPDISNVLASAYSTLTDITGAVMFENTDKTFKKWVAWRNDSSTQGNLMVTDVETPAVPSLLTPTTVSTAGYRKSVQYNNTLYWPSLPTAANTVTPAAWAWNGVTAKAREAGIDIQNHMGGYTTFAVDVTGAGSLTFATGRKYTWTLYDPVNLVESMPANNGAVLTTVDTGAITSKAPVVTITWTGSTSPNISNTSNNHTRIRLYATTDGGSTYFLHSTNTIASPDSTTATVSITDSTTDAVLSAVTATLVYNSPPPPARFFAKFQNKLVAGGAKTSTSIVLGGTGETVQPNVLYYTLTDQPEHWPRNTTFNTGTNAIPFKDQDGDELVGAIQVNRVLLVGLRNSIWSINHLPISGVDPLFNFDTLKDRIVNTHGFVSANCYCNLQLTDDEDAAFYVSQRGFHLNSGSIDRLVSEGLRWDKTVYNDAQLDKLHITNYTTDSIIIVGFASAGSSAVDSAFVYHYHPSHLDESGIGKITGPWSYPLENSALVRRSFGDYEMWGTAQNTVSTTHPIVKLSSTTGIDYNGVAVPFEWETGWLRLGEDTGTRLRELNFLVEETGTDTLTVGAASLAEISPRVRTLQANSSGPALKLLWDDDTVTLRQVTATGTQLPSRSLGSLTFTTTDRAIVSASADLEVFGEEKSLAVLAV